MVGTPLSIYIHVPFCTRKCDYCHFYVIPKQQRFVDDYLEALALDIKSAQKEVEKGTLLSIYFGGGTPSLLESNEIASILALFKIDASMEITFEANPESITVEKVKELKQIGINRISIGIQSFNDDELKALSRQHGAFVAKEAVLAAYKGGIENISIDLIYDLPSQTKESFAHSLQEATALPISHLSLYNLTIEPHTAFYKRKEKLLQLMPKEKLSLDLLESAEKHLESHGLMRYEISAYAKVGKESIHNSGYWTGRSYLGFGPSAHSFYEGVRTRKNGHFQRWVKALREGKSAHDFSEQLPSMAAIKEKLVIGLRLFHGIELMEEMKSPALTSLIEEGFVLLVNGRVLLTKKGRLFYDYVAEILI